MAITKDKVKRSAIGSSIVLLGAEYMSGSILTDFEHIQNYEYQAFKNEVYNNFSDPMHMVSTALSSDLFLQAQPFLFAGALFLGGKILFQKDHSYEIDAEYGAYGTSRWARKAEIYGSEDISTKMKTEGTIIARHNRKPIVLKDDSFLNKNICIVGGSGGGKTRSNIIPNILKNQNKSMVIIDPKGELYEKTSEIKREHGYKVRLVNFKNRKISDRFNPLEYVREDADAYRFAKNLVDNTKEGNKKTDFFELAQTSVLQACVLYVKYALPKEEQHMGSVLTAAQLPLGILQKECYAFPEGHIVRKAFKTAVERLEDPKTQGNVLVTLMQTLNPWQYNDVISFTSANDFIFDDIANEKTILYVIIPVAENDFRPLISTFFTQMFNELYRLADRNFGELPIPVYMALDEFANVGKIPDFEQRLSTVRSYKIEPTIVLQDLSQLERVYGKEISREIINNCDTHLMLKANEQETQKYFSQMAGKTTIKIKNSSSTKGKNSSSSHSYNYAGRDLITPDEVKRLPKSEQLLFIAGEYPMKINKPWFDDFSYFTKMLGKKVSREEYPAPERGELSVLNAEEVIAKHMKKTKDFDFEIEDEEDFFDALNEEIGKKAKDMEEENKDLPDHDEETGEILDNTEDNEEDTEDKEDSVDDLLKDFKL